jgi:hypothetical protein
VSPTSSPTPSPGLVAIAGIGGIGGITGAGPGAFSPGGPPGTRAPLDALAGAGLLLGLLLLLASTVGGWWLLLARRRRRASEATLAEGLDGDASDVSRPRDLESGPRWLRPSLHAARYNRDGNGPAPRQLVFDHEAAPGIERRLLRFDLVPLLASIEEEQPRPLAQMQVHDEVEVLDRQGPWFRVRTPLGSEGWISESRLGPPLEPDPAPSSLDPAPAALAPAPATDADSTTDSPFLAALAAVRAAQAETTPATKAPKAASKASKASKPVRASRSSAGRSTPRPSA